MNGFRSIKNVDFLIGAELTQVCIGANEIILNFYPDGISIAVFSAERFVTDNAFLFEPLCSFRRRIRQIGKTVTDFVIKGDDTASVVMSDGSELVLVDDSPEFEAITIRCNDDIVVI